MLEAVLSLVNRVIVEVICLIGSVGFLMALYSLGKLIWQIGQLHQIEQPIPYDQDGALKEKFAGIRAERRHATIRQLVLQSFYKVFQKHRAVKAKDRKDIELSLPSAGDLREMTLQSELSGIAPSSLNTIVSFLLILGIFGTMSGVHDVLQDLGLDDIQNMKPALRPSVVAIIFTVVLIMLRALYAALLDHYLIQLDEWTAQLRSRKKITSVDATQELLFRVQSSLEQLGSDISTLLAETTQWRTYQTQQDDLLNRASSMEHSIASIHQVAWDNAAAAAARKELRECAGQLDEIVKCKYE